MIETITSGFDSQKQRRFDELFIIKTNQEKKHIQDPMQEVACCCKLCWTKPEKKTNLNR